MVEIMVLKNVRASILVRVYLTLVLMFWSLGVHNLIGIHLVVSTRWEVLNESSKALILDINQVRTGPKTNNWQILIEFFTATFKI